MAVFVSRNLVLSFVGDGYEHPGANYPIIGWHNLVTISNISSSWQQSDKPVTNLANPNTASVWSSDRAVAVQYVTVNLASGAFADYLAIARHNLMSAGATVTVQVQNQESLTWIDITDPRLLSNDGPTIFRFALESYRGVRLKIETPTEAPTIGVLYVGQLTVMPRSLPNGHTPINFASMDQIVTGTAESGDYLGRVVTSRALNTSVSFQHLSKSWFDEYFLPFMRVARERPFFFAWLPFEYPDEAAFCWTVSDIRPEAQRLFSGIHMNISFQIGALVR